MKESSTKMGNEKPLGDEDEVLPEYDFRGGVRGKYGHLFPAAVVATPTTVELAPDVAEAFPDADAVNEALRTLLRAVRSAPPNVAA